MPTSSPRTPWSGASRNGFRSLALPARFRRHRYLVLAAAIVLLTAAPAGVYFARRPAPPPAIPFSDFVQRVESGAVTHVTFGERAIDVTFRDGAKATTIAPPEFLAANSSFVTDLVKRQIRVDVTPTADPASPSWSVLAVAAAFFALLAF